MLATSNPNLDTSLSYDFGQDDRHAGSSIIT